MTRWLVVAMLMFGVLAMAQEDKGFSPFREAKPVWAQGRELEKNLTLAYRAVVPPVKPGEQFVVRIAASTDYQVYVDNVFRCAGPARGPHGWFRVDEWDITDLLSKNKGVVVAIVVAGYNSDAFATTNQASFLQAEVAAGDHIVAATGNDTSLARFVGIEPNQRVQKVFRYSFQRAFSEVYRLNASWDQWRRSNTSAITDQVQDPKSLLKRHAPYPKFDLKRAVTLVSKGTMAPQTEEVKIRQGNTHDAFPESEIEIAPAVEMQKFKTATNTVCNTPIPASPKEKATPIDTNAFCIYDLGVNRTGFLGATIQCDVPTRISFAFDEILTEGDVNYLRMGCSNVLQYQLEPGIYKVDTFEPYTMRYVKAVVLEGACTLAHVQMREYVNPATEEAEFKASDEKLNRIFTAGVETFRQNAVDIFMDCPSRERAGWLCDSFFTARVAKDLGGNTAVEHDFVENFLLPAQYPKIPDGMLPMCYPSDHTNGSYIPNWALWFVVELEEYAARSGDRAMVDALKPKVLALFDFFKKYENSDGLLEKLDSWVFVEWSKANDYVQDVNFPSNMLYAGALDAAARLYDVKALAEKANSLREVIRKQAYDGEFFVDNALRKDGKLEVTRNRTETCQYYAFFFDIAKPDLHPQLWKNVCDVFGPKRTETKALPEIAAANSFIGNMLRFEILSRNGRSQQILTESVEYLLYMAERTGTLWENTGPTASCNHGFASHIVHTLYRDVLGLYKVDTVAKRVQVRFTDLDLDSCKGCIPTPDGNLISLDWKKSGGKRHYRLILPEGYTAEVTNLGAMECVKD